MTRLLAPRLLPWHLLILAVCALFLTAGFWQLSRHEGLRERNALLTARLAAPAEPYLAAAAAYDPDAGAGAPDGPRYRPVVVAGRFAGEHEVLLRGRSFDGRPGFHVLTPLLLDVAGQDGGDGAGGDGDAGRAVLVDRGWIPYRYEAPDVPAFAPPAGPVRVEGRLMPAQTAPEGPLAALAPRDPPSGTLDSVARPDVDRLQAQMPWPLDRFVVEAERIEPVAEGREQAREEGREERGLPLVPPPPEPEDGPHLGYALQWFSFAMITIIGYVLLVRRRLFVPSRRG